MNKGLIIGIIAAAALTVGGYLLILNLRTPEPKPVPSPQPMSQQPEQKPSEQPSANQNTVTYTDSGYSPNILRIKTGTTVTFKNESSQAMWTASAVHPTHRDYPTTGGCLGSTFDACQGIQPGGSWSFKFDIAGSWKYHNHLSPGDTGTIVVE